MVFFFALAAKEVFEATLPGGALASPARAVAPLAAAVGGMVMPAAIYVALASTIGPAALSRGWAIPCATDIAFSAMIARAIFPAGHPAIPFLLLLAIADDALGLIILAVFYPSGPLSVAALGLLMTAALLAAFWLRRGASAASGRTCWARARCPGPRCTSAASIRPWPCTDRTVHAARASRPGAVRPARTLRDDALDRFEHWWARPCSSSCCCLASRMPA